MPLLELKPLYLVVIVALFVVSLSIWGWWDLRVPKEISLTKVDKFHQSYDKLIFVYGSLLVRDSLLRTLHLNLSDLVCIPCHLDGFRLDWGEFSKKKNLLNKQSFSLVDDSVWASIIIVKSEISDNVDGAIIGLSNKDYIAIRNREKSYYLKDVTSFISVFNENVALPTQKVFSFFPMNEKSENEVSPNNICIRKKYFYDISLALKSLGHKGLKKPNRIPLREAYLINEQVEKNLKSRVGEKSLLQMRESISHDMTIAEETRSIAYSLRPLVFPKPIYEEIKKVAETAVSLSTKALHLLDVDEELQTFGYSEEDAKFLNHSIEKDILTPAITRVDLTISGNRILVLEVNADSPGGMRHLDILSTKQSSIIQKYSSFKWVDGRPYNASDAVVQALQGSCSLPKRAAIVEFRPKEWPTYPEMLYFVDLMEESGVSCEIIDLQTSSLIFKDNQLFSSEGSVPIDLVYKRILWEDFSKAHEASKEALSQAFLSNSVAVVNSLGSRMAGNKLILTLLKSKRFIERLSELGYPISSDERKVIDENMPRSSLWGDLPSSLLGENDEAVKYDILNKPYEYVLKSLHGYGGDGVLIGCDIERPVSIFESKWNGGYIAQEYIPHGRALMPVYREGSVKWEHHHYILGAYVINGKCVAIEAKSSPSLPINMKQGAYRTAVFSTM